MRNTQRHYQEISHFRRPYSNMPVAGFGLETGAPPPPQGTLPEEAIMEYMEVDAQGRYHYKPDVADALMQKLKYMGFIHLTNTRGKVYYYDETQRAEMDRNTMAGQLLASLSGAAAVKSWVDGNMVVVASSKLLFGGEGDIEIGAISAADSAAVTAATVAPYGMFAPILAMPLDKTKLKFKGIPPYVAKLTPAGPEKAGIGVLGIGIVAAGALGVGYLIFRKK